jgi:hypothetical protein
VLLVQRLLDELRQVTLRAFGAAAGTSRVVTVPRDLRMRELPIHWPGGALTFACYEHWSTSRAVALPDAIHECRVYGAV